MHTEKLQLSDIRYNPEHSAFEAKVKIHDRGESFEYPSHVVAPLQADFATIARGLVEKAQNAHTTATPPLRMRKSVKPVQTTHRAGRRQRNAPLMMRMLRALAA